MKFKTIVCCLVTGGLTFIAGFMLLIDEQKARAAAVCVMADDDGTPVSRCISLDPETATRSTGLSTRSPRL